MSFAQLDISSVVPGRELPSFVFGRPFRRYFFFDADISSSEEMIGAVRGVVDTCFGVGGEIEIFSSGSRNLLGRIGSEGKWEGEVVRLGRALHDSGDAGGLLLADDQRRWVVYQARPIDVGIFAINCGGVLDRCEAVRLDFFDVAAISLWLQGRTERDFELVQEFGGDFLESLVANYS